MAYERVNWKDYPDTTTPITAANLNKMDEQIKSTDTAIGSTDISEIGTTITGAISTLHTNAPFKFGIDSSGNYGYYKDGADTVTPFNNVKDATLTNAGVLSVLNSSGESIFSKTFSNSYNAGYNAGKSTWFGQLAMSYWDGSYGHYNVPAGYYFSGLINIKGSSGSYHACVYASDVAIYQADTAVELLLPQTANIIYFKVG